MMTKARFAKDSEGFTFTIEECSEETVKTELNYLLQRLSQISRERGWFSVVCNCPLPISMRPPICLTALEQ